MFKHVQTCAVLLSLLAAPAARPQGGNSTVRGLVRDQAQAIIPSAAVTLTNVNTNVSRSTLSNEAGIYVFPGVIPGSYRLTGEFAGMQKFEGNLTVQTSSDLSVGGWGPVPLFEQIGEFEADDATYVEACVTSAVAFAVGLTALQPPMPGDQTLRVRMRRTGPGDLCVRVSLIQSGSKTIATRYFGDLTEEFLQLSDNPFAPLVEIDVNHDILWKGNCPYKVPTRELIARAVPITAATFRRPSIS